MPPRREGWIDWLHSKTREIVLQDLNDGTLPLSEEEMPAQAAWNLHYKHLVEVLIERVQYDQFEARVKDHREQVSKKKNHFSSQMDALRRSRELNPPKTHNKRGEINFTFTEAAKLLKKDIEKNRHNEMTIHQLFLSRDEYHKDVAWDENLFRRKVHQFDATQKFFNYMNDKRKKKEERRKKAKARGDTVEEEEEEEDDDEYHYRAFMA